MTSEKRNVLRCCLNMASDGQMSHVVKDCSRSGREKLEKCVCRRWRLETLTVTAVGYSKLVSGSRPESLPRWHVSDTGEV